MGLDASVMCNCYAEGRTTPSPFPGLTSVDEDGYLSLNLPYLGNEERYERFYEWTEQCCEHPHIRYACECISNWPGVRLFQAALGRAGWEHFPTLKAELPEGNGGEMSAAAAARALEELAYFRERADLGSNLFLINSETGEPICEHVAAYRGVFILSVSGPNRWAALWSGRKWELGIDERGFFIQSSRRPFPPRELFRSLRFEQRLLQPTLTAAGKTGKVEYLDLESGRRFVCTTAISEERPGPDGSGVEDRGRIHSVYPRRMHVETRKIDAASFASMVGALTRVCEAAVTTGNPVCWA